jgi:hypothetical protein
MDSKRRLCLATLAAIGISTIAPEALAQGQGKGQGQGQGGGQAPGQSGQKKKQHHNNGKDKLGDKIKQNGNHVIDKKGDATVSVDVKDQKVAGMKVKHAKKGDLKVTKYKTNKKMAAAETGIHLAAYDTMLAQAYSLGTTWIGYSYYDDYGDEQIYWYPVEMIYDGDTGAIDYVPIA